jgi:hypothetical protein
MKSVLRRILQKLNLSWILLGILTVSTQSVCAQQKTDAVPLILEPAEKMEWTMTVKICRENADGGANAPSTTPLVITVQIIKDGLLQHVIITDTNGVKRDLWRMGNNSLTKTVERKRVVVVADNEESTPYGYYSPGFYGIEHVKPSHESGMAEFEKNRCRHFAGALSSESQSGGAKTYEAWFDAKTGLPRGYREDGTIISYEFAQTPPADLKLPGEYQAGWDKNLANLKQAGLLAH